MRTLLLFIFAISTPLLLLSQNTMFSDWDLDNDQLIERHEFTTKFIEEYYPNWEPANEQGIIEKEYYEGSYAALDTDNDNYLSDEEWLLGYNYFIDDYVIYDELGFVDTNEDGMVSYEEYYDALYDTPYFSDIDVDSNGHISEYELAYFVFDNWDFDDSQTLSRSEFNRFDWYYLDV